MWFWHACARFLSWRCEDRDASASQLCSTKLPATTPRKFGHPLETFAIGELLKQASWSDNAAAVGHWRTHNGQEVDLVVERDDGAIAGFEIKAGCDVKRNEARDLIRFDDRIYVCPIDRLWNPTETVKRSD
jgi:uncharacterized protein